MSLCGRRVAAVCDSETMESVRGSVVGNVTEVLGSVSGLESPGVGGGGECSS